MVTRMIVRMFVVTIVCVLSVVASRAFADPSINRSVSLSWDLPIERTDGTVLDISDISHTNIYTDCADGNGLVEVAEVVAPGTTYSGIHNLTCQTWTATVTDTTTDGDPNQLESDWADPAIYLKAPPGRIKFR